MQKNCSHRSYVERYRITTGATETQKEFLRTLGPKVRDVFREVTVPREEVQDQIHLKSRNGWKVHRKRRKYGLVNIVFTKKVEC